MTTSRRGLYKQVAALHVANINQGFLSTLGVRFVALLYRAIDECEDSSFFVEESEGRVVGFVSGATGMGPIYRRMLHYWPALFASLFPSMFNPRCLRRILEILKYSRGHQVADGLPNAELLSIAVDPAYRGQRRADFLYEKLASYFRGRGEAAFMITVGKGLAPAHRFYRRMGAVPVTDIQVHKGEISTVYVHRLQ
jgi:ribosomal protein S18 acetylase RimI-like enzyme